MTSGFLIGLTGWMVLWTKLLLKSECPVLWFLEMEPVEDDWVWGQKAVLYAIRGFNNHQVFAEVS